MKNRLNRTGYSGDDSGDRPEWCDTRSTASTSLGAGPGSSTGVPLAKEDVDQEAWLRVLELESAGRYDPSKGSREAFRAGVKRRVRQELGKQERRATRRHIRDGCVDRSTDPADLAVIAEQNDRVRRALDSLDQDDADLIKRRFGLLPGRSDPAPMSSDDRSRLCRAMHRLRELLWSMR